LSFWLALAVASVLLGAGIGAWRWHHRSAPVTGGTAIAVLPREARLLAAAERTPDDPGPYSQLAEEYASSERPVSALWACGEAAARAPRDAALRLKLAELMAQTGYVRSAETELRAMLTGARGRTAGPAAEQARRELAELLLSSGRPAEALAMLGGTGPEAEILRGRAREAAGDDRGAAGSYLRAGQAGDPDGFERLARLELALGDLPAAREAMRALGGLRAARPSDLLLVAAIHAAAGTPEERGTALARVRRCLQLQPDNAEAHYRAGLLYLGRGEQAEALDQLQQAIQLDPNHAEARRRLADLLQGMGQTARAHQERAMYEELKEQPDRALDEFRRAGAVDRGSSPPSPLDGSDLEQRHLIVSAAKVTGQQAAVIGETQDALKRHPGDVNLMLQLGLLYREGRSSRPALDQLCREWISLHPTSGMPYWLLGCQAEDQARTDDAIRFFTAACAKEPDHSDFCMSLGVAYTAVAVPENLARARPWFEKAIALNPRLPGPYQQLGWIMERSGDLAGARRCYLRSLDLHPADPRVLSNLVRASARIERPAVTQVLAELARDAEDQARTREQLAHRVRNHPAEAAPRVEMARFLIRQAQLTAARNQLERAAEAGPAGASARRELAVLGRLLRVQSPAST
jgi:tetratricopeptide (TPR) repeat protein